MEVLMKEKFISFLEVIKGLIKFPIVFGLVVVAFALNIIQEFFPTKGWIQFFPFLSVRRITAQIAAIIMIPIITSYEFIFLGCLIPDYFSQIERERDNSIKKMEERNSILENNQSHQS